MTPREQDIRQRLAVVKARYLPGGLSTPDAEYLLALLDQLRAEGNDVRWSQVTP